MNEESETSAPVDPTAPRVPGPDPAARSTHEQSSTGTLDPTDATSADIWRATGGVGTDWTLAGDDPAIDPAIDPSAAVAGPGAVLVDGDGEGDGDDEVAGDADGDGEGSGRRSSGARIFLDWVVVIAVALLVAFLVRGFVLAHFVVDGSSMSPTLESGDRVFVNKLSYRLHDPNRGDVVVLHQISGASERDLIKRVLALPGEEIEMRSCQVFIDGAVLTEPYLDPSTASGTCGGDFAPVLVPPESVFVMGDNRGGSQDSRQLGPIAYDDLVGRAFVVFWPSSSWQWL